MTTVKNEIIKAFKNSCASLEPRLVKGRSLSVGYQFQRGVWEIDSIYGLIRISDKVNTCCVTLFPLIGNGFNFKKETVFEITKNEYEELRELYFGEFKEDKEYSEKWYKNMTRC